MLCAPFFFTRRKSLFFSSEEIFSSGRKIGKSQPQMRESYGHMAADIEEPPKPEQSAPTDEPLIN